MTRVAKPSWANPSERWMNQGEKLASAANLPDGRIFGPIQKRADVTPQSIIGRAGVTAVMNYQAPEAIRHGFHHAYDLRVYAANQGPGQANTWTRNEMRAAASAYALFPIEGNDFGEGSYSFAPDSDQAFDWYERRAEMYADPSVNPTGLVRHDYGHHAWFGMSLQGGVGAWYDTNGGQPSPTNAFFRDRYQSVANARAGIGYFNRTRNGKRLEDLVGMNVKFYAETADYARGYYQKRFAIEIMGKGMGKVGGLGGKFLTYNYWPKLEGVGNDNSHSIGNGLQYKRRINDPAGYAITGEHPQMDYDFMTGCALVMGFLYSDGVTHFDVPTRFYDHANKIHTLNQPGNGNENQILVAWQPDVVGTAAPVENYGFPVEPMRWVDSGYEAAYYYAQMSRTAGVGWQPIAYRFQGSENWIEPPADGASTLEHAAAFDGPNTEASGARRGRPTVDGRWKNNASDFVAFDASRSKLHHETILVRAPNGVDAIPVNLQGCVPAVYNQTI